MVFLKRAFLRRQWSRPGSRLTLRAGRFEWTHASETTPPDALLASLQRERISQRLVGSFAWTHVGRSFDGLHLSADLGRANYTVLTALATRGAFQVDGWGPLKTALTLFVFTRHSSTGRRPAQWRLEGIYYHDWRHVTKTDNRPLAVRQADFASLRLLTFDGHHLRLAHTRAGTFDALAWIALQAGHWGELPHRAYAVVLEMGWQPSRKLLWKPWLRMGWCRSSGDRDPADRRHQTFHQLLPTPRQFARAAFYNMMNSEDRFGSLLLRPSPALALGTEFQGRKAHPTSRPLV
ncbi:MAG: alginate export family protein [Bryobacteraceae bacterium]